MIAAFLLILAIAAALFIGAVIGRRFAAGERATAICDEAENGVGAVMGAYEGTRLGTITLCAHCGFAVRLVRCYSPSVGEFDNWVHFRVPITPHTGVPKHSVLDLPVEVELQRDRATDGRL